MRRLGHTAPHSPEWHAARKPVIGASETAPLMGLGRWGSPAQVWASKVGDGSAFAGNEATQIGTALERRILDAASAVLGVPILDGASLGQLGDDVAERLTCHLDGWIGFVPNEECQYRGADSDSLMRVAVALLASRSPVPFPFCVRAPVEAKWTAAVDAPSEYDALEAWLVDPSQPWPDALRYSQVEGYWCQVQAQLAITGAPYGYLVSLLGDRAALCATLGLPLPDGSLRVCRISRDEAFITTMRAAVTGFWSSHVETREPPAVTEADLDALRRTPRAALVPEVEVPDLAEVADEIEALKGKIKEATAEHETRLKVLQAAVEARILAAGCDRLRAGGWTISRSKVDRKATPATTFYTTRYARAKGDHADRETGSGEREAPARGSHRRGW